jgi:signal transduction histidine kinase
MLIVFLGIVYLASAALSWIAARSARAGMEAIDRALEREREMTTLKDLFITDANHELRTPIMAMYNDVKIAARLGDQAQPDVRERLLARALKAGETLLQTLNIVLDIRMLENDAALKLTPQPVAIAPLLHEVIATFDPRADEATWSDDARRHAARDIVVAADADVVALADPLRVRQILVNLIANALKYSEPGTAIHISAARDVATRSRRRSAGQLGGASTMVLVRVQDYGLGIPPRDIPKLFHRFVRLPRDIAGPVRGNGLGLYICQRLTHAMGGTIWVNSAGIPGAGSTFSFMLPAASQPATNAMP